MRKFVLNRTLVPVLIVVTSISLCLVAGLSYYTYRLNHELKQQQAQTASSRVLQLLESAQEQQVPSVNPQTPADPFASLFASPFSGTPGFADPFQQMNSFRQQMDSFFNSAFLSGAWAPGMSGGGQAFVGQPDIQVRESPDAVELVIPVQEGTQLELNTDVQDNRLIIAGTLQWQEEHNSAGRFVSSSRSSRFSRTVPLPGNVDATGVVTEHRGDEVVVRVPRV